MKIGYNGPITVSEISSIKLLPAQNEDEEFGKYSVFKDKQALKIIYKLKIENICTPFFVKVNNNCSAILIHLIK